MNTIEKINQYFETRTQDLKDYFFRFCLPEESTYFSNLLSELYIHVIEREDKLKAIIDDNKLHFYCVRYIYNQRNWNKTNFKKEMEAKETFSDKIADCVIPEKNSFELEEESLEDNMKNEARLNKIRLAYHNFTESEKILYRRYFIEKETMRQIAESINVPTTSIYKGIEKLREKIKNTNVE